MDSQKQQAAERVKQANNILVTVSSNPSVDQLAACIGLTLSLNKMGKHATAVFSGTVPSTIEFLQPEKTIERNTDSLRDFIIALDKSKADKLRYKVEDRVVKIFITPYRTSINEKDLEFSQGDFNVDVILALGVHNQADLDQAITSHGRILHDATVITVNVKPGGELGGINWLDPNASSLSELSAQLIDVLDKKLIDGQIATALLTGIVAETERFSNSHTSPQTMSISAELMANGANQQLVATKLEEPAPAPAAVAAPIAKEGEKPAEGEEPPKPDDGTLEISHEEKPADESKEHASEAEGESEQPESEAPVKEEAEEKPAPPPEEKPEPPAPPAPPEEKHESVAPQIHIDEHGAMSPMEELLPPKAAEEPPSISHHNQPPKMVLEPPTLGGQLTASAAPDFGETAGLPPMDAATMPTVVSPSPAAPAVGPAIVPPTSLEEETPSGGAAPADSFLVGNGSMPVITPTTPLPPSQGFPEPEPQAPAPATERTLSDIEKDVNSPHTTVNNAMPLELGPAPAAPPTDNILPPLPPQADSTLPLSSPPIDTFTPPPTSSSVPSDQPVDAAVASSPASTADVVSNARDAVAQAINGSASPTLDPIASLNAQPVNLSVASASNPEPTVPSAPVQPWTPPIDQTAAPAPQTVQSPQQAGTEFNPQALNIETDADPNAPPPVPPPMMPPANPY
jgi:hypothetical protein